MYNQGYVTNSAQRMGCGPLPGAEVRPAERRHRLRAQPEVVGQAGQAGHPDLRDDGGRRPASTRSGTVRSTPWTSAASDRLRAGAGPAGHRDPQGPVAAARLLHAERREPGPVRPAGAEGDLRGHRPRADRSSSTSTGWTTRPTPSGSMILLPFQSGYADNVGKVVRFDPEQAKKDLDAAGWTVGPDGVRVKDGQPLDVHLRQHRRRPGRQGDRGRHRRDAQERRDADRHPPGALRRLLEDPHRQAVRHVLLGDRRSPTRSGSPTSARSTAPPAASSSRA